MTTDVDLAANAVAEENAADVFFLSGEITRQKSDAIQTLLAARKRRETVLLVLVTQGGDPDAAYRIARAFQFYYPKVLCFVPGWRKSAGTLITLAASRLHVGDLGKLGRLDIQLPKQDELDEAASGLLIDASMQTLETMASRVLINILRSIRRDTGVTTRMAAELSVKMVVGLMAPIFSQVEPMKIGENARAMNVTLAYGARLNLVSKALRDPRVLDYLVTGYPDHGVVIDRTEAETIYADVGLPTACMVALADRLGRTAIYPPTRRGEGRAESLSGEPKGLGPHGETGTMRDGRSAERLGGHE